MAEKISIGGQAVIEGVMMRSMNKISVAVRKKDGDIVLKSEDFVPWVKVNKFFSVPVIRGIVSFIEILYWGIKVLEWSAQMFEEKTQQTQKEKIGDAVVMIVSFAVAIAIFVFFPIKIGTVAGFKQNPMMLNLITGAIRLALFIGYIFILGLFNQTRRFFQYHGAEHKTINAFENSDILVTERVKNYSTFHPRCGTSFLLIVGVLAIAFFSIIDGIIYLIWGYAPPPFIRTIIHLGFMPVLAGISYELLKLTDRFSRSSKFGKIAVMPGKWLQKLSTKEPEEGMIEVAIKSLLNSVKDISINGKPIQTKNGEVL